MAGFTLVKRKAIFHHSWGMLAIQDLGYDLEEILSSQGSMIIRKATRLKDQKPAMVACTGQKDEILQKAAQQECDILNSIAHPNIIRLLDFFETKFDLWICFEWCEEGNMRKYVEEHGTIAQPRAMPLLKQLFDGLACLEYSQVVHNHLRLDVLFLQNGVLKIGGLLYATYLGDDTDPTLARLLFDKIGASKLDPYVAPELRASLDAVVSWDTRADVWSAGMCGLFMLRGLGCQTGAGTSKSESHLSGAWSFGEEAPDLTKPLLCTNNFIKMCLLEDPSTRPLASRLAHVLSQNIRTSKSLSDLSCV